MPDTPAQPDPRNVELCLNLARLQAVIAQDRVTGEDDDCIHACGVVMNFLANEWGLQHPWIWDCTLMHDTAGADPETVATMQAEAKAIEARAHQTVSMLVATGEAPTEMRSLLTTQFVDLMRQDGMDVQIPKTHPED